MLNNNRYLKKFHILLGFIIVFTIKPFLVNAQSIQPTQDPICVVYLTGIGCGNCAIVDPLLLVEATSANPNLIIFEYEIFRQSEENFKTKEGYFDTYLSKKHRGVPFLLLNKEKKFVGRFRVLEAIKTFKDIKTNPFPQENGSSVEFKDLNISALPGSLKIWTKNRVLISGKWGKNRDLKKLLVVEDIWDVLKDFDFQKVEPKPVDISHGKIEFQYAVKVGDWQLQWNGDPIKSESANAKEKEKEGPMVGLLVALIVLGLALASFRIIKTKKGASLKFDLKTRMRDIVITGVALVALCLFFIFAKDISPDFLEKAGVALPLPVFTFFIALVDGFNPCNMFVLTCLLALLISTSHSRQRLYVVALSFVFMVFIFYYVFMAAWLNVFKYIGFIAPLRIGIAVIALIAGMINCKELFFFKKGISLTIQDKHKGPLMSKIQGMKEVIANGSFPLLITSSLGLAALASLVELPCTAGFPIIYTGVLSGKGLDSTFVYYFYLFLYNVVYVLPLLVIILLFINTFRARQITQRQMEIIKFIGGIIMILLGIVLLVNPGLIGLGIG